MKNSRHRQIAFIETHLFETSVNSPAFINVSIAVTAPSIEAAEVAVSLCRCSLICIEGELGLYRDGELFPVGLQDMSFYDIKDSALVPVALSWDQVTAAQLSEPINKSNHTNFELNIASPAAHNQQDK